MIKNGVCLVFHLQSSRSCGNTEREPLFQIPIFWQWFLRKRRYSAGLMMAVARTVKWLFSHERWPRGWLNIIERKRRVIKPVERMKGHTT
jgi:hypothetical protein